MGLRGVKGRMLMRLLPGNQSSTDAYMGLGLRTFILGGGREMTHREFFKEGAGL